MLITAQLAIDDMRLDMRYGQPPEVSNGIIEGTRMQGRANVRLEKGPEVRIHNIQDLASVHVRFRELAEARIDRRAQYPSILIADKHE
ncbi:extracellular dihydrogeodin oxidase/laccase [Pseudozyma hubeiensis SY62]|uniref:Extracellular dihydrogeodin oxidase/laccase n=1 Tax=Pseudozyma hubeiensis (strain SY62) TaxID=1305764 RepID=R9P2D2_PSEHS|nr:extracellular dihydrogeodin oxidase/laccase [Pseudozyma hubeiensis SY62]GAC95476.1 extracellular dihydrogeodin oxidase/laccase [Pseudozyma hubeiensis SY62]